MKKIACLSALAAILAVTAGSAVAASTVSGGYAQSDAQGVANKTNGFNLKYRYENDTPLGYIGSFTYTEKDRTEDGAYNKAQYYGVTGGPAFRINDWASIYGVVGVGYGKFQQREDGFKITSVMIKNPPLGGFFFALTVLKKTPGREKRFLLV